MSLSRYIEGLDESDDADWALLERTIADARETSEDLAFAIKACAVPRRFDAEIIGVLRAAPEDADGNVRLLRQLRAYSFVRRVEQGGYTYHDHTREKLLEHWRTEPEQLELEHLTWRLVAHYEAEHTTALRAADDAARVSRIIAKASPERFAQLAGLLEAKLITPLAEAISQLALLSARTTLEWAIPRFDSYEDSGRYASCLALIRRTADIIAASPAADDTQEVLDWLSFWEGRQLSRMSREAEAEVVLQGLVDRGSDDVMLRYWTLGELGTAQKDQFKLKRALETFAEEVALGEQSRVDEVNLPLSYVRLGQAYLELSDPDGAAEQFRLAAAGADRGDAPWHRFWAYILIAQAEIERAQRPAALDAAFQALDISRTLMLDRRSPHGECADLFGGAFADEWPPLIDAAFGEGDALVASLADHVDLERRRVRRMMALRRSGQYRRARRVAQSIESSDPEVAALRSLELGRIEEARDHVKDALEHYTAAHALARDASATRVAIEAQHRAAELRLRLGELDAAERELAEVEERWATHGHERLAALARAHRAGVCLRRADVAEAERLMESAGQVLVHAAPGVRIAYLWARADHETALGRLEAADDALEEIAELAQRMRRCDVLYRAHRALAQSARARGDWEAELRYSRAGEQAFRDLTNTDGYKRSRRGKKADEMNAEGVRLLVGGDPAQLPRAMENLLGAIEKDPSPWYELNASYAAAAGEDWDGAIRHLERALADAAWLRVAPLERRLGEHHVARGQALMAAQDYAAAADAFEASLRELTRPAQADSRTRCLRGRGEALHALGDLDAAANTYREAHQAGDLTAPGRLGDVHAQRGERAEALASFRSGLAAADAATVPELAERFIVNLDDVAPHELDGIVEGVTAAGGTAAAFELGERLQHRGREADAVRVFAAVADRSPEASLRLAAMRRASDPASARAGYERALADGEGAMATDAGMALGDLLLEQGDTEAAIGAYRRAVEAAGPEAPRAGYRLAGLLMQTGRLSEAEFHLRTAVAVADVDVAGPALVTLGDVLVMSGRPQLAEEAYQRAIALDEVELVVAAADRLLHLYVEQCREDKCAALFGAVLHAGAKAGLKLAERLVEEGRRGMAADLLRAAAEVRDDLYAPDAQLMLGSLLAQDGRREEAHAAYWRALESGDPVVAPQAAERLMADGERRTEAVDRLLEGGGLAALNLGDVFARHGYTKLAERAYRRVADDPDDLFAADAVLRLGDLLSKRGDLAGAEAAYRRIADTDALAAATARQRLDELERRPPAGAEPEQEGVGA